METNMEDYVWRRRINHAVWRRSKSSFPEAARLGLEFNKALPRASKLDAALLTNGVVLEFSDFAKTVGSTEMHFLFEILDFNFHLGVDLDRDDQVYDFARRTQLKAKHLREFKHKPLRWHDPFQLPDTDTVIAFCAEQKCRYFTKMNKTADVSVLSRGGPPPIDAPPFHIQKRGSAPVPLTPDTYPCCRDGGVALVVDGDAPRPKRNAALLTTGVMLELLDFAKILCGSYTALVLDLVHHNFNVNYDRDLFRLQLKCVVERRSTEREAIRNDRFIIHYQKGTRKRKKVSESEGAEGPPPATLPRTDYGLVEGKAAILPKTDYGLVDGDSAVLPKTDYGLVDGDSVVLPKTDYGLVEGDSVVLPKPDYGLVEGDSAVQPRADYGEALLVPKLEDEGVVEVKVDSEVVVPQPEDGEPNGEFDGEPNGELSYMCPVDFTADAAFGSEETEFQLEVKEEDEEVSVSMEMLPDDGPRFSHRVSDLFSEGPDQDQDQDQDPTDRTLRLWARRGPRSKQILKSIRVNDRFPRSREVGLDYNVASGSRRTGGTRTVLDRQLLTNQLLWEVFQFASFMAKSLRSFLFEILDLHVRINFQDQLQRRNLLVYMITKERVLQGHPDRRSPDFLKTPFQFPEVYTRNYLGQEAETPTDGDPPEIQDPDPDQDPGSHPYCRSLGLDLWSLEPRSRKLDLAALTTGSVLEMFAFVRELCGATRQTLNQILEHNFDLDLQTGSSEASRGIQRWISGHKVWMKRPSNPKARRWLNMAVQLSPQRRPGPVWRHVDLEPRDPDPQDLEPEPVYEAPQEDQDPYQVCRRIGLDLDVVSRPPGARPKLDPGVLTRRVLLELHHYVQLNCNRYVPGLYEILDFNFPLAPGGPRKVEYAWALAGLVGAIARKTHRRGPYLDQRVELPVYGAQGDLLVCKEEPEDQDLNQGPKQDQGPDQDQGPNQDQGLDQDQGPNQGPNQDQDLNQGQNQDPDLIFVRELRPVDIEVEID